MLSVVLFGDESLPDLLTRARKVVRPSELDLTGKTLSRQLSFCAGRAAVAALVSEVGPSVSVRPDPMFGYLKLHDEKDHPIPGWFVNISHTSAIAVAALGCDPIGIDVERVDRSAERVLPRVSTKNELARSHEIWEVDEGTVPSGIALWSAKEAMSKAIGLGIKFGMRDLVVKKPKAGVYAVEIRREGPFTIKAPAVRFLRYRDWVISVCSEQASLQAPLAVKVTVTAK